VLGKPQKEDLSRVSFENFDFRIQIYNNEILGAFLLMLYVFLSNHIYTGLNVTKRGIMNNHVALEGNQMYIL